MTNEWGGRARETRSFALGDSQPCMVTEGSEVEG